MLAAVMLSLLTPVAALAADESTLLRVFLTDGTSLVSYGEVRTRRGPGHFFAAHLGATQSVATTREHSGRPD